jgi:hypothetical protein
MVYGIGFTIRLLFKKRNRLMAGSLILFDFFDHGLRGLHFFGGYNHQPTVEHHCPTAPDCYYFSGG